MASASHPPPRRRDDRIILHFDYDCFYAQVVQNRAPGGALIGRSVGVTQKSILATCNYEARRRGVRKLMRISEARRIDPDIVLVDGEDLSPFRDVSKQLYRLVRDTVGSAAPVERLGLDEVFVDATALVDMNLDRLLARPADSRTPDALFLISSKGRDEPRGFPYDSTSFAGHVIGDGSPIRALNASFSGYGETTIDLHARTYMRLLLGSQLAAHLRHCLEHEAGYTSSAGIATSKVLSKLAGKVKKPANQTVLVSAAWVEGDDIDSGLNLDAKADAVVWRFMDQLPLRSVPGIGFKTSSLISGYVLSAGANARKNEFHSKPDEKDEGVDNAEHRAESNDESNGNVPTVTVGDVRTFPGMSPRLLDEILVGNNNTATTSVGNIPTGWRVWGLLHGVDDMHVRSGRDLPTQISIEDTYAGPRQGTLRPDAATAVSAELHKLATSLLRRMHVDLAGSAATGDATAPGLNSTGVDDTGVAFAASKRGSPLVWLARPRTLRLTLRPQMPDAVDNRAPDNYFARMSRSQPLPGFVLNPSMPPEQIVDRLVAGSLVPMFRKLAASVQVGKRSSTHKSGPAWTVGLLNVCVANMSPVAGQGDDIAAMLKRQDHNLHDDFGHGTKDEGHGDVKNEYHGSRETSPNSHGGSSAGDSKEDGGGWDTEEDTDGGTMEVCAQCGHLIPVFALEAHARYHVLGD
ncbi:hypothetical protein SBRCBS47491_008770 [Sporothrix bragantina]|uniref:UmuC domain-containing protein n=1 Tax=Sporothrix bragantina TaxID=671064 RepID=A0ABP0CRS8_9PEZI